MIAKFKHIAVCTTIILLSSLIFIACKKDKIIAELSYTMTGDQNYSWTTDEPSSYIKNDTLFVLGRLKDKTSCTIAIASSMPGTYECNKDLKKAKSLVSVNIDGTKSGSSNFLSIGGNVNILENNTDNKTVNGQFNIIAVSLDLTNIDTVNIDGVFSSEYVK